MMFADDVAQIVSALLARCHWTMKNDVRIAFNSDVSVEKGDSHFSQVEDKHTISMFDIL